MDVALPRSRTAQSAQGIAAGTNFFARSFFEIEFDAVPDKRAGRFSICLWKLLNAVSDWPAHRQRGAAVSQYIQFVVAPRIGFVLDT